MHSTKMRLVRLIEKMLNFEKEKRISYSEILKEFDSIFH